jgi:hypothetical protein
MNLSPAGPVLLCLALAPPLFAQGDGTLVPPTLTFASPDPVEPGAELEVGGSGGYLQLAGGGVDDSSRLFWLTFDGAYAGQLECLDDACTGGANVPQSAAPGAHLIATEGGSSLTVEVLFVPPPPFEPVPPAPGPAIALAPIKKMKGLKLGTPGTLTETDVIALGGGIDIGPLTFVTAAGAGGGYRLQSWRVDAADPHLADGPAVPGSDVRLEALGRRGLFVSAARTPDGNLWLTTWRIGADGTLSKIKSLGYGANAGVTVAAYALAHRELRTVYEVGVPLFTGAGQHRFLTWHVNKATGNLVGQKDSGDFDSAPWAPDTRVTAFHQRDALYAVRFSSADDSQLRGGWHYWRIEGDGSPALRGSTVGARDSRGVVLGGYTLELAAAAAPLTGAGAFTVFYPEVALPDGRPRTVAFEHNEQPDPDDPSDTIFQGPYRIADDSFDGLPGLPGVLRSPPAIATTLTSRALLADGLFEQELGAGAGALFRLPGVEPPQPATAIASVTKTMTALLAIETALAGKELDGEPFDLDTCLLLENEHFGGSGLTFPFEATRVGLVPSSEYSLRTLLVAAIVTSDRVATLAVADYTARVLHADQATTFAERVASGSSLFLSDMNLRAAELGMGDSLYCGVAGAAHSTRQDQVTLYNHGMLLPEFRDILDTTLFTQADVDAEAARCGGALSTFSRGHNYPIKVVRKGGDANTNFGVGYDPNGQLACDLDQAQPPLGSTLLACRSCLAAAATRLERTMLTMQSQVPQSARLGNSYLLLDYGFEQRFTPDWLGSSEPAGGPSARDIALDSLDGVLAVTSSVKDDETLEVCWWEAAGGAPELVDCATRQISGVAGGEGIAPRELDVVRHSQLSSDGDYLVARRVAHRLTLDLWRVGPRP